jgi:hypothetical protein
MRHQEIELRRGVRHLSAEKTYVMLLGHGNPGDLQKASLSSVSQLVWLKVMFTNRAGSYHDRVDFPSTAGSEANASL